MKDWPLLVKFLLTPCLALMAFGGVFYLSVQHTATQTTLIRSIVDNQLGQMSTIAHLSEEMSRINFSIFHRLTVSALYQVENGESVPKLIENVTRLREEAEQLQRSDDTSTRQEIVSALLIGFDAYVEELHVLDKKLDVDYEASLPTLPKFDHLHGMLQSRLQQLTQVAVTQSQALANDATLKSDGENEAFLMLAGITIILTFLISLVMARTTVGSITGIAETTQALASGRLDMDLDKLNRGDELGKIVASLHTFRNHIQQLEAANRAKNDFLAQMSHELRTPLNSIIGMSDLILDEEQDQQKRQMLEVLLASSGHLLTIINDILDISKIEAGRVVLEHTPFTLQELILRAFSPLQTMASSRGLLLSRSATIPDNLTVMGDPLRMESILTNLLSNAIKYTPKGSVHLTTSHRPLADNTVEICFNVKDTGIGIPADKLGTIFEKFMQADVSTTRKYGGTGLGLSITKSLTEMMGGAIMVESHPGLGSSFIVTIPFHIAESSLPEMVAEAAVPEAVETPSPELIPVSAARILLAEDHPLNQAYMKKMLSTLGVTNLHIAENGQLALEAYQREPYDLVLMDCHMPSLNGYDTTSAIRRLELENGGHIPIVAMTANAMAGERERCLECGMDDYISKPVSKATFRKIVSRWLNFDEVTDHATSQVEIPLIFDVKILDTQSGNDEAIRRQFVNIFIQQSAETLKKLSYQCTDGHNPQWTSLTQELKIGSAAIGALRLRGMCARAHESEAISTNDRRQMLAFINDAHAELLSELNKAGLN